MDYIRITDPVTARKAKEMPGLSTTPFNQSVIQGCWVNSKKKPFDDRACGARCIWRSTAGAGRCRQGTWRRCRSAASSIRSRNSRRRRTSSKKGWAIRDDTRLDQGSQALLTAAGHPNGIKGLDFLVRDVATFKLWAQAIQAMLAQIDIECKLRTVVESVWFDDTASGHFDLAVGAIVSTLLDPSDYFNAWYRTGGPQNYGFWNNEKFNGLVDQIDRETDPAKRIALARQCEDIMEQDPPVLPICWEQINDVWYNYVKGHKPYDYFGIYDVVRLDTFWLDKA